MKAVHLYYCTALSGLLKKVAIKVNSFISIPQVVENMEDIWGMDLDYSGKNNYTSFFSSSGNIHSYPAKALPDMVHSLLNTLKSHYGVTKVLDPFVGSGTVALESKVLDLDFYGSDLNPLAVLLARTKALTIQNKSYVEKKLRGFLTDLHTNKSMHSIQKFTNIDFWFKHENICELSLIKSKINDFLVSSKRTKYKKIYAMILLAAFSSTIRTVSLTRNSEFKLYRMSPSDILKHNVDAIKIFDTKVINLIDMLEQANKQYKEKTITEIHLSNAKELSYMSEKKVDLIFTSPPYGDSKSTVAYGQFSKLSLQWMDDLLLKYLQIKVDSANCDELLLGGRKSDYEFPEQDILSKSQTLSDLLELMKTIVEEENQKLKISLSQLKQYHGNAILDKSMSIQTIISETKLSKIIKERIRLDVFRKINKSARNLNKKEIKTIAKKETELFLKQIVNSSSKIRYKRLIQLEEKLPFVKESLERKIKAQPKRIKEVMNFFKDLYKVVVQTDKVLEFNGLQAWIVGHRTVLGKITINMEQVLNEWFQSLGYENIKTLERQYSFKRMPHNIKSTISRDDVINTMMQEHIIVVRKLKLNKQ
jgi:DNA modification methylase